MAALSGVTQPKPRKYGPGVTTHKVGGALVRELPFESIRANVTLPNAPFTPRGHKCARHENLHDNGHGRNAPYRVITLHSVSLGPETVATRSFNIV